MFRILRARCVVVVICERKSRGTRLYVSVNQEETYIGYKEAYIGYKRGHPQVEYAPDWPVRCVLQLEA